MSFPLRERGLKLKSMSSVSPSNIVVPLAGTWIETFSHSPEQVAAGVVPLAGTWIETESGGKQDRTGRVVPLAGTWIETFVATL